jgi:endo-1,4-beta-mannosidase
VPTDAPGERAPFRLGINYWPSRTAMRWWTEFDAAEVAGDFGRIAANGFDSVRLFLLWEAFQPQPDRVDRAMLRRLVTVADLAGRTDLQIMPTLFTGHMSGVDWIPAWALGGTDRDERFRVVTGGRVVTAGLRNWYADALIARSQALFASEAATALAGHESLWAWDLGNENSNCVVPPDRALARGWLEQVSSAIRAADGAAAITIGLHMEDLEEDRNLGPREASEVCDFLTMHGYPIYARWAGSGTDEQLVPFLARVTRWLGGGRDVLFSEFGLPTFRRGEPDGEQAPRQTGSPLVEEQDAAHYTGRVLAGLREAGCIGAMLWCYADYSPDTWGVPPLDESIHERHFGLWRADGSAKPALAVVAASSGAERVETPDDGWIDIDEDQFWERPGVQLPRLYRRYRDRAGATST